MALEMGQETPSQEGKPMDTKKVLAPQGHKKMGVFYGYPDTALWEPDSETAKKCLSRMSGKHSRTVLRRERAGDCPDLAGYRRTGIKFSNCGG